MSAFANKLEAMCTLYDVLRDCANHVFASDSHIVTCTRVARVVRRPESRIRFPEFQNYGYRLQGLSRLSSCLSRLNGVRCVRGKRRRGIRIIIPGSSDHEYLLHY